MERIFMSTQKSKTNASCKFDLKLSLILDLRSTNKHVAI